MAELYVLRHGIAEPRRRGVREADRQLTEDGRDKLEQVLGRAHAAKVAPEVILSSPFARAVQTAEMALKALGPKARLVQIESLLPDSTPESAWQDVRKHARNGPVMIAGHEPLLGRFISYLVGADHGVVDLKKGALACLDVDAEAKPPQGLLLWLLTPRVCARQP
jgi:phosphohistidine phosphatase